MLHHCPLAHNNIFVVKPMANFRTVRQIVCTKDPKHSKQNVTPFPSFLYTAGPSRLIDAVVVAFIQTLDGKKWFASTTQLQLAPLQLCLACRSARTLHFGVRTDKPRYLWADDRVPRTRSATKALTTRVPALRPETVTWRLSVAMLRLSSDALSNLVCVEVSDDFNENMDSVTWPSSVRDLKL